MMNLFWYGINHLTSMHVVVMGATLMIFMGGFIAGWTCGDAEGYRRTQG